MSNITDLDLNLETLFQPAWAQGKTEANRFEKFTGEEGVRPERRFSDKPGERRGPRREGGGGARGERRGGPPGGGGGEGKGKLGERQGGFGRRGGRPGGGRDERRATREEAPPMPLPDLNVVFIPEEKGVEQLARQIKMTGRAYPLFQIAQLILDKAERYAVQLTTKKKADGAVAQPLFVCALDDSPWTSEDEAVAHVLKHHFATFYQMERTPTDPPKGVYTFVAQCSMSGVILGPPNYHDYQNQLRRLHAERFARMPFDAFKARVKIVRDEAVVKKWIEAQSFKTEYNCLNVAEPLKLAAMEEVEKHFRATHKDSIIKAVDSFTAAGPASRRLVCPGLQRLIRQAWEQQKHFPLALATRLSQQFANHGLQFFKVNKTVTHVNVARPTFLDVESSPVSDGIKRIVEYINANPKCARKKLIEALAPTPKATPPPAPEPAETPAAPATETPTETPVAEGAPTPAPDAAAAAPAKPKAPAAPEPTPEQTAVMVDLHWLIHQGAVLEFADGRMETAKKPAAKPQPPEKKAEAQKPAESKPVEGAVGEAAVEAVSAEVAAPAPAVAEMPAVETEIVSAPAKVEAIEDEHEDEKDVASAPVITEAAAPAPVNIETIETPVAETPAAEPAPAPENPSTGASGAPVA